MPGNRTIRSRKTQTVKLIEGTFDPEDARHLLLSLITYKISFHEVKRFSDTERLGKTDAHTERRIAELKESRGALLHFLDRVAAAGSRLRIDSAVRIRTVR